MTALTRPLRRSSHASSRFFKQVRDQRRALAYELLEDRRLMVTNVWNPNIANGNWDVDGNWSLGHVPRADEDVKIGNQTVTFRNASGVSPIIKSLTTDGPFKVTGRDALLRVAGAFSSTADVSLAVTGWLDVGQLSTTGSVTLGASTRLNLTGATKTLFAGRGILLDGNAATLMNAVVDATTSIAITSGVDAIIKDSLTLNSTLTVGQNSILGFQGATASLLGTGTVVLDNKTGNGIQLLDDGMTLTIGPGMTVRGGNTSGTTSHVGDGGAGVLSGTLRVEGKIIADAGRTIRICDTVSQSTPFANTLQIVNAGVLQAAGGTLDIAGKFTTADAARITQSAGGTINLIGQLDNTGQTWNFPNGPWNLKNGKIVGGTLTQGSTNRLNFTSSDGVLNNVQINGDTIMAKGTKVSVVGDLTYNGTLTLGQLVSLKFSSLTARLLGSGTIVFDNLANNEIVSTLDGMTLTIGAGITIRGGNSQNFSRSLTVSISAIYATASSTTLKVDGKIIVDSGRKIIVNWQSAGLTQLVNNGVLDAGTGTLFIDGKVATKDIGSVKRSNGEVNIVGTVDNAGANLTFNSTTGKWNLFGGKIVGGTITQGATNFLAFTASDGTLENVRIDGDTNLAADSRVSVLGTLTLSGTTTLNDEARVYFDGASASVLGNGTVLFLENANSGLITRQNDMTLTIGKDITIRGGHNLSNNGFIGYRKGSGFLPFGQGENTNVRIEGKVVADLPGRQIGLRPTNKLINVGLIQAKSGYVVLDGFFTREDLGDVRNSDGGIIKLAGTLDNQSKTLSFDGVTGSWSLSGGTIVGGTIIQSDNSLLFLNGGKLDGVTIKGDVDLTAAQTQLEIVNGLTLDGQARLGKDDSMTFLGDQTLDGRANIVFQNLSNNSLNLKGKNMTLTIGPDVVISGGGGTRFAPSVIADTTVGTTSPRVILNGTIRSNNPATNGGIEVALPDGALVANGKLEALGGELRIKNSIAIPAAGAFVMSSTGSATFGGDLSFAGRDPSKIQLLGTSSFSGSASSPQLLEALSQDLGPVAAGFSPSNYLLGTLVVKSNTKLRLIDLIDNATGTGPEAVYVNSLIIEANADLNVGTLNLYYRSLSTLGSASTKGTISTNLGGTHLLVKAGGELPFNLPTPGTIDATQRQHDWTFQGTQGGWVTLNSTPGTGLWLRMRLFDASNNLLKTVVSAGAGLSVTISNFILPSSGIFHVLLDADPLHANSVGTYVITLTDSTPNRRVANITITSNQAQGVEYGASVEFIATVTAQAPTAPKITGFVQFNVDGVPVGGPVLIINGMARLLLPLPKAGARSVTANFISDNGNFDNNVSSFIQQIKKRVLTIKATDIVQRVAGTAFTLQYSAIGFVPGEDAQVLTGSPVLSVDTAATNTAGNYVISVVLGTLAANNYSFQFINATMTVLPSVPFRMDIVSGAEQKVIINRALPLMHRLRVLDEFKNPIPNASVLFAAPTSGSSGTFVGGLTSVSVNTSALGEAQAPAFTVNDVPGNFSITATCNGIVSQFRVTIAEAGAPLEFIPLSGPISETAGTVKFSLQRNTTITSALTVNLTSNHPEFVQLPSSTITFPINVDTVLFDATIINDNIASGLIGSGPKDIAIQASASGLPSTTLQVEVNDDDVATLALQLSPNMQEGDKTGATLSRNTSIDSELTVRLTVGDTGVLSVPTTITIPAGQLSVVFDVRSVADHLAFGPRTTSLTAQTAGMTSAKLDVSVIDVDVPTLTLEPINSTDISEKDGSTTYRLRRNSPPANALAVGISSSLPNSVDVLSTVIIPQDSLFVDFTVNSVNDTLAGSDRNLTITASAGTLSATGSMTIREDDSPELIITLDSNSLAEGPSTGPTVMLYRNTVLLPELVVDIAASEAEQIFGPTQVKFDVGSPYAFFTFFAIDDAKFEGTQSIRLRARASGFSEAISDIVTIEDNETLSLTSIASVVSEKGGQTTFTVTRQNTNLAQPLVVSLLSTDTTELTVPLVVTIPANATSATFFATAVDDNLLDGSQSLQVLAFATGYVANDQASVAIGVSDYESLTIEFDTITIAEAAGTVTATITRSNTDDLSQALAVTIDNSADSRIHFQSNSIIIPAGEVSTSIAGTVIDNLIYEGDKLVTVTVSAAGFASGTTSANVLEDEHAWHNHRKPLDVNNDSVITAIDALLIINRLNTQSNGDLPPQLGVEAFVDTNLDDHATPIDALLVINELNKPKSSEGEQAADNYFAGYDADHAFDLDTRSRRSRRVV